MNWMKKIAAGALAVVMAGSLAACGADTSWTYKSGDITVTSGMYVGISIDALNAAYSVEGYDSNKSPFSQDIEGTDSVKWMKNKAGALSKEYIAVEQKFTEMGLSLTEEEQNNITATVDFYWTSLGLSEQYDQAGCSKESFTKIITNSTKKNMIFEKLYGEGGEKAVSEADLKTIFQNDYAKGVYITIPLTDDKGTALTGDALDKKKDEAQKLADRITAGEDFEKVKAEYNAANSEEASEEKKDEPSDTSVVYKKDSESLSAVASAIVKGKTGELKVVSDDKNSYVYKVLDVMSGDSFEKYSSTVLHNLKDDEFNKLVSEWASAASIEENSASLNKHSPKNLKKLVK